MNSSLLTGRRAQAIAKIDAHIATLNKDVAAAQGEASLRAACLKPLEALREQVQKEESLAHITQAESEAVKEFDAAVDASRTSSASWPSRKAEGRRTGKAHRPRWSRSSGSSSRPDIVKTTYLETSDDVNGFLDALGRSLRRPSPTTNASRFDKAETP